MMKRLLVPATLATVLATLAFAGCGGSTSSKGDNGTSADGGNIGTGPSDSGSQMLPSDSATPSDTGTTSKGSDDGGMQGNPPLPDGSILPSGNQLVPVADPSSYILLNGVTSDDYAIYTLFTATTQTAYAVSLTAGSKPISLGAVDPSDPVTVLGKVVFLGTSAPDQAGAGAASIWTSAAQSPTPLSTSTVIGTGAGAPGVFAVSSDGAHVLFLDGIDVNDTTAAIAVAGSDGTGKVPLVPSVSLAGVCFPEIAMAGTTTIYAVATYCETGDAGSEDAGEPDGGTNVNVGTVSSFVAPNWTLAPIASNVQTVFSVDQGATTVVVNGPFGTAAYPIAGGNQVLIDATGVVAPATLSPGILTNGGANLVYTTSAQALMKGTTGAPATAPTPLVASGFTAIYGVSPDQNWLVGTLNQDEQDGTTDLWFASAAQAGTATALSQPTTGALSGEAFGGSIVGDLFTTDSLRVLFQTAVGQSGGTLNAASVTAPGTATALGSNAFCDFATSAGKVVFNANLDLNTNEGGGSADLFGVDTAGTTAPAVLVTAADPTFFLNNEKTTIVYTWSYEPGTNAAGLWALAAP